jgi:hypothetical protein
MCACPSAKAGTHTVRIFRFGNRADAFYNINAGVMGPGLRRDDVRNDPALRITRPPCDSPHLV